MPLIDAKDLVSNHDVEQTLGCDICVIGTGPAGSTIARELSGTKLRVTVLESGGFERRQQTDDLNAIESIGHPRVMDQWKVRNRIVGGSSYTWSGRCAAFDEIDFEYREWVPHSGWPIDLHALMPFLDRSARYLGLGSGTGFSDERFWDFVGLVAPSIKFDPTILRPFFWQFSRDTLDAYEHMRFGRHLMPNLFSNIQVVTNATVLSVDVTSSGSAVKSVYFAGPDGRRWTVPTSTVVICAGAIENARLLLCSDSVQNCGLGNGHDLVGRYLMDHLRGAVAKFRPNDGQPLVNRFGLFKAAGFHGNQFQAGFRLSPEIQRHERLLNCSGWIEQEISSDDPWDAVKRILRGNARILTDMNILIKNTGLLARGLQNYFVTRTGLPRRSKSISLIGMCEQVPDPQSRITLSLARDSLGQRLPTLNWRINLEECRTMSRMAELALDQFSHMGLPTPLLEQWVLHREMFPDHFEDVAHPTGTTRMSDDPKTGVVDRSLRVHGVHGLYIAGSSVFPTSGHCNPTQMIVALALRLADELKATFQRTAS